MQDTNNTHNLIAYLATVCGIVVLALAGAAVCLWTDANTEVGIAKIVGALAFIGAAVAGLTGIAGTFKASQQPTNQQNIDTAQNVTTGKGEQA